MSNMMSKPMLQPNMAGGAPAPMVDNMRATPFGGGSVPPAPPVGVSEMNPGQPSAQPIDAAQMNPGASAAAVNSTPDNAGNHQDFGGGESNPSFYGR